MRVLCRVISLTLALASPVKATAEMYEVGGHRIEVSLEAESPRFMVGEPVWVRFRIQNRSDKPLSFGSDGASAAYLWGNHSMYPLTAVDNPPGAVPVPRGGEAGSGAARLIGAPAGGEFNQGIFVPAWITFTAPGRYTLLCRRQLQVSEGPPRSRGSGGQSVRVEARVVVEVQPYSEAGLAEVIQRCSEEAMAGLRLATGFGADGGVFESKFAGLDSITDARAVAPLGSLYLAAIERGSAGIAARTLRSLGKFKVPAAREILERASRITTAEIRNPRDTGRREEMATIIREAATAALNRAAVR